MYRYRSLFVAALLLGGAVFARAECVNLEVAAKEVPFEEEILEDTRTGVAYLSLIGGSSTNANDCGLNPDNDDAQWTGWGGPLDTDNASIGEGIGQRNYITIGGIRFERGIGTHALATYFFDISGAPYKKFEAYVGMDDEKDAGAAGAGDSCGFGGTCEFNISVDGKVKFESGFVSGMLDGDNVDAIFVEIDLADASELLIEVADGGDGIGCDHAAIGDAKLLTGAALAVDAESKAATTWSELKTRL
ncbi:hypothetical protein HN371_10485 [Candidatus Poribacteria bacterium]|mgnify:FL=1|nr:hypothetical protein [Candidatus Poribacteria bacterium]MBT5532790.1 hypothetical protein [Candidatus Poribacteria bacterium]MBT5711974.1 hypothetical protein [Candidatus Poribacteria bacterium]MBT7097770.1 hypothetical protein [Candidatus Poribacteria bacterium]MBT7808154.1 hypothetical protein [Candidatus Poribacteria bacterium]